MMKVSLMPDLDILLSQSDYISLHCSLTYKTKGVFQTMPAGILNAAKRILPANIVNRESLEKPEFQKKLAKFKENNC